MKCDIKLLVMGLFKAARHTLASCAIESLDLNSGRVEY